MSAAVSRSAILSAAPSPIDAELIRRLQAQRDLHKGEAAYHLAEAEKHGAADAALASMIQAAEKLVAIMLPASTAGADDQVAATAMPAIHDALPTSPVPEDRPPEGFMSNSGADGGGNPWRTRFLRSGA